MLQQLIFLPTWGIGDIGDREAADGSPLGRNEWNQLSASSERSGWAEAWAPCHTRSLGTKGWVRAGCCHPKKVDSKGTAYPVPSPQPRGAEPDTGNCKLMTRAMQPFWTGPSQSPTSTSPSPSVPMTALWAKDGHTPGRWPLKKHQILKSYKVPKWQRQSDRGSQKTKFNR